jgi:hypothetical protein
LPVDEADNDGRRLKVGRRWVAGCVVLLVLVLALSAASASAMGRGGVDRSFGGGGTVKLGSLVADGRYHSIRRMVTGPERNIFIADFETSCADASSCTQAFRLVRLRPDGTLDGSYGIGGSARIPSVPSYAGTVALAIDESGRAVVAIGQPGSVAVLRLTSTGQLDGSFGSLGSTVVPCGCELPLSEIGFDHREGIAVTASYTPPWREGRTGRRILAARLTPSGALDPGFGVGGVVDLQVPGYETRSTVRGDGSILVTATLGSGPRIYLSRIDPRGAVDAKFSGRFRKSLLASDPSALATAGVVNLVPGPRGSVALFGGLEGSPEGFALRVLRGGGLDRSFSGDGFKRFPLRISVAAAGGRGRLVTAGGTTDGLSIQTFDHTGRRDRSIGRGRSLVLASWDEATDLAMQGRRPLLFDNGAGECRSYCPPKPKLLRLKALP